MRPGLSYYPTARHADFNFTGDIMAGRRLELVEAANGGWLIMDAWRDTSMVTPPRASYGSTAEMLLGLEAMLTDAAGVPTQPGDVDA